MGDTTLHYILDLDEIKQVDWPPPVITWAVEPPRMIIKCYDLCLKVPGGDNQVNLFHQAFTKWYNKV